MPRRSEPGVHLPNDAAADVTAPPGVDAGGKCEPTKANLAPIPWAPPAPLHVAACSPAQVDFLARGMVAPAEDTAMSAAWDKFWVDPANDTCLRCAVSDANATPRGPLYVATVADVPYWFTSHEGCVAALANDGGACGAKLFSLVACSDEMCSHCTDDEGMAACLAASDATTCAPYTDALDCMKPFEERCYGKATDDYVEVVKSVIRLFCTGGA